LVLGQLFAFRIALINRKLNTAATLFWVATQMNRCSGTEKQKETLMKKFVLLIGILGLLLAMVGEGVAATIPQSTRTPTVNRRQNRQHRRIRQGVRSGQLTRAEAARLRREQARIAAQKRAARRNGRVSPAERARLRREQNRANRRIYRAKHNNRRRP
jgi:hypothetical protein